MNINIEDFINLYKSTLNESDLQELYEQIINNELKNNLQILNKYINTIYDYKYLNTNVDYFSNNYKLYFKFTNKNEIHKNFKYNDGFNFDINKFNPFGGTCSGNGLYFCDIDHLYKYIDFGINIRPILIPKNIPFVKEEQSYYDLEHIKYKTPVIFLLPYFRLGTSLSMKLVHNTNYKNIKYFKEHLWINNSIDVLKEYINNSTKNTSFSNYAKFKILLMKFNNILNSDNTVKENINNLNEFIDLCNIIEHKSNDFLYYDYIFELFLNYNDNSIIDFLYLYFNNLISNTEKKIIHNVNNYSISFITLSLKNITFNNTNLFDYLKNNHLLNNCYISGSYALKFLLNLNYEPNDIDIYIEYMPEIYDYLIKDIVLNKFINKIKNEYTSNNNNIIVKIINFTIFNKNIQFIFTNSQPVTFIKNNFDFDFCTCCYDLLNNKFIYETKYNYFEGYIQDNYIKDMTLDNKFTNYRAVKTISRCIKYINRGFYINNINDFLDHVKNICFYDYK